MKKKNDRQLIIIHNNEMQKTLKNYIFGKKKKLNCSFARHILNIDRGEVLIFNYNLNIFPFYVKIESDTKSGLK